MATSAYVRPRRASAQPRDRTVSRPSARRVAIAAAPRLSSAALSPSRRQVGGRHKPGPARLSLPRPASATALAAHLQADRPQSTTRAAWTRRRPGRPSRAGARHTRAPRRFAEPEMTTRQPMAPRPHIRQPLGVARSGDNAPPHGERANLARDRPSTAAIPPLPAAPRQARFTPRVPATRPPRAARSWRHPLATDRRRRATISPRAPRPSPPHATPRQEGTAGQPTNITPDIWALAPREQQPPPRKAALQPPRPARFRRSSATAAANTQPSAHISLPCGPHLATLPDRTAGSRFARHPRTVRFLDPIPRW